MIRAIPWSYTKLSTYETCPAKAKFRYDQRLRTPRSAAASRGEEIHQSIEDVLKRKKGAKLHEAIIPYQHVIDALKKKKVFVEGEIKISEDWKLLPHDAKPWGVAKLDNVTLPPRLVDIQEWKSGKVWPDHDDQRRLYLLAGRVKWPYAPRYRVQTYYFDQGTKKVLEMTHEELDEVQRDFVTRIAIMVQDDILAPRPGYYCGWCDYAKQKGGPCRHG